MVDDKKRPNERFANVRPLLTLPMDVILFRDIKKSKNAFVTKKDAILAIVQLRTTSSQFSSLQSSFD